MPARLQPSRVGPLVALLRDQRGLSNLEYAVLFIVLLVGALALWHKLGSSLTSQLDAGQQSFSKMLGAQNRQDANLVSRPNSSATNAPAPSVHGPSAAVAPSPGQPAPDRSANAPDKGAPAVAQQGPPQDPSWTDHQLGTKGKVAVGLAGAAAGVLAGAGVSWATAYGSSLACGPAAGVCAGAVTLALVGYGGYKLYNGGWAALKGSFGRVFSSGTASVGDALAVGSTLGGLAYGAGTSFGRGAAFQRSVLAHGARTGAAHREVIGEMLSGAAPPAPPPPAANVGAKGDALRNAAVQEDAAAAGLNPYKNLTSKDFSSPKDPRLEAIRQIADRENREVAEAIRAALQKRGISNVEVQQRTKSAASILGKLQEKDNVKLSDIKDLSGIRINIKDVNQPGFKQHDEIMAVIKEVVETNNIKDYNKQPNPWGYTGRVHAFTEGRSGVSSEIQVGSRELSQFIESKFTTPSGARVEVHDLTGYKGQLYGKSLPPELQARYTELIGEIGRANGAGKNAADVPELKAGIDAFRQSVQEFLTGPGK